MQANYRQIASTSASYQPPSLTTDGLLVAAPATPELPAAQLVSTELLAVHLPTSNLPAAPHKAINLPAVTADASRQPAAPSALWLQPAVQQDCTGLLAVPHSLHRSPATLCDQSILPAAACGYTILLAARAHECIQPADRMNTTRLPVESYYGPKRALNRQVLILCTKRSRSVSDITSMQSVVRNQYRLVLRKWNDEMVSEIPSHSTVNMHF